MGVRRCMPTSSVSCSIGCTVFQVFKLASEDIVLQLILKIAKFLGLLLHYFSAFLKSSICPQLCRTGTGFG